MTNLNPQLRALLDEYIAQGYTPQEAMQMMNSGSTAPTIGMTGTTGAAAAARSLPWFSGIRNKFGAGKSIGPNIGFGNMKGLLKDVQNTDVMGLGTVKGLSQKGMGLYQGAKALKGFYNNANLDKDYKSLKDDISVAVAGNPMYDMYLDAEDEKLLRQMNNGTLSNNMGGAVGGAIRGIPQALISALIGGAVGGAGGAAINGIGSLVNSGISGYGQETQNATNKLQGLYGRLKQAESEYKTMKRPRGLGRAGLSTQYFNQLY